MCDPATGQCVHTGNPTCSCITDTLRTGDLLPISCDDGNPCTVDTCDPVTGRCVHTGDPTCPCTIDTLRTGDLLPISCDDGNPCTVDTCDPATGNCVHTSSEKCFRYNAVRQKFSHNSYVRSESIGDQLIYHRVRGLEFDLQRYDPKGLRGNENAPSGDWFIFHGANCVPLVTCPDNYKSSCEHLSDCLKQVRDFHLMSPNHEVLTIIVDNKDSFEDGSGHGPADLDARIRTHFGPDDLWTPADLLASCPGTLTLQSAISGCGWPQLDNLRGKLIFLLSGTGSDTYEPNDPVAFVLKGVAKEGITADTAQIFFQPERDQRHLLPAIGLAGFVTRFDANSQEEWDGAAKLGVHLIATNKINAEKDTWATTVNGKGWPFQALCGPTPDIEEDARAITVTAQSGNISGMSDDFVFLHRTHPEPVSASWSAAVSTLGQGNGEGCLMARVDDSPESPFIAICRPSKGSPLVVRSRFDRGHGTREKKNGDFPPNDTVSKETPLLIRLDVQPFDPEGRACGHLPGGCTCATGFAWRDREEGEDWTPINSEGPRCVVGELKLQGLAVSSSGFIVRQGVLSFGKVVFADVTFTDSAGTAKFGKTDFTDQAVGEAVFGALDGFLADPARAAEAETCTKRTDDRVKPIYFVHGHREDASEDCNKWNAMSMNFRAAGHIGPHHKVSYYVDDKNCDASIDEHGAHAVHHGDGHRNGSHTADTPIEHLGYHLAWLIFDQHSQYGESVDVVAHSMGGLIIRYAIAQTQLHEPGFPPYLLIEDVVTLGTPHGGARLAGLCRTPVSLPGCTPEARQMRAGSPLLKWLEANAWAPEGLYGTDWTTMGSDDDNTVAADRAAATARDREPVDKYMQSSHKVWYTTANNIEHDGFVDDDRDPLTAEAFLSDNGGPFTSVPQTDIEYPVKRAELAVTYGGF